MRIIDELIKQEYTNNAKFNKVIVESLKIKEIEMYLRSLDKLAILYNKTDTTLAEKNYINRMEDYQDKLMNVIRHKIIQILTCSEQCDEIVSCAEQINYMLADNMDVAENGKEYEKLCLVIKLIASTYNHINSQQKTLYNYNIESLN